jgi:hypothetical protein
LDTDIQSYAETKTLVKSNHARTRREYRLIDNKYRSTFERSMRCAFAGKRGPSAAGFVIERKAFELVLLRRRNRDFGIGPAVG